MLTSHNGSVPQSWYGNVQPTRKAGLEISFFLVVHSKLLLPGARPGSKTIFVVAKLYVDFLRNENIYCKLYFHNAELPRSSV